LCVNGQWSLGDLGGLVFCAVLGLAFLRGLGRALQTRLLQEESGLYSFLFTLGWIREVESGWEVVTGE